MGGTLPLMGVASAIQIKVMMGNQKADTKQLEAAGKVIFALSPSLKESLKQ